MLVTFDDCYTDLADNGLPVLQDLEVPAVAFAVADLVGGTNTWDVARGAPELSLLDAPGLLALQQSGIEIGVHGSTHRPLTDVSDSRWCWNTRRAQQRPHSAHWVFPPEPSPTRTARTMRLSGSRSRTPGWKQRSR